MSESDRIVIAKSWFLKAENDIINAEHTMTMSNPPCDTVCFHAEQCAEKYLKGFLTYHQIEFPKTHSIETLVRLCKQAAPAIEIELGDIVEILTSYGVAVRYPDGVYYDIPKEDAIEAIELAKKVKACILKQLEGNM
ncbi:HEPN domain-containing protein [Candidatus Magnetomonas plexicatena]|uniref:HEPN domain-containing protein n=1 Tax=Candidatus Magnetomonas plexicatena TaxID=2552947 RepID=UPI00110529D9|nr:HEPN domain-containing protein [Nitrospirales bacterium LBB_01]